MVQWLKSSALNCGAVKEQQLRDGEKELSAEVKKLLRLRQRANKALNNSARFGAIPFTKAEEKLLGQEGLSHVWRPPWVQCRQQNCTGQEVPQRQAVAVARTYAAPTTICAFWQVGVSTSLHATRSSTEASPSPRRTRSASRSSARRWWSTTFTANLASFRSCRTSAL